METWQILQTIWYILIGVLLVGYSILDGFDLGIGILTPFLARKPSEKRILFNAIGPFWDGNEVWLLTAGGALFAAFPQAYATVFSGFYLALMLVLFALIFRAVSLEFWSHDEGRQKTWEWTFVLGSFFPALLFGVALGNVLLGIPLNSEMQFTGSFFTLLRPYPLVLGVLGLTAILMQGSTFTILKTSGQLQQNARKISRTIWWLYLIAFILSFVVTFIFRRNLLGNVVAWVGAILFVVALLVMRRSLRLNHERLPFMLSSAAFLVLWAIVGAIHFPNLVNASNDSALSLTIHNASSSELTLTVMLIIALVGMPIVIGYTLYVYRVFKGKVQNEGDIFS